MAWPQALGPSSTNIPSLLAGIWIGSRAHLRCWHCQWQLYLLHHLIVSMHLILSKLCIRETGRQCGTGKRVDKVNGHYGEPRNKCRPMWLPWSMAKVPQGHRGQRLGLFSLRYWMIGITIHIVSWKEIHLNSYLSTDIQWECVKELNVDAG